MKRDRREATPKQKSTISWLTTPPLKQLPSLRRADAALTSSPTCIHDPSPLGMKKRKKTELPFDISLESIMDRTNIFEESAPSSSANVAVDGGLNCCKVASTSRRAALDDKPRSGFDYERFLILESSESINSVGLPELRIRLLSLGLIGDQLDENCTLSQQLNRQICDNERILIVSGDWLDCDYSPGKLIHLIDYAITHDCLIVNNQRGYIVIEPDRLITPTAVSDSFQCLRSAVLKNRIKYMNQSSMSMIQGSILHSLFQEAIIHQSSSSDFLQDTLKELVKNTIEDLYAVGVTDSQAINEFSKHVGSIQNWIEKYHMEVTKGKKAHGEMMILKTVGVEETIWSPVLGLKGNIDVTVRVSIDGEVKLAPLELKTGKNKHNSHRAQTLLYTMMMQDRYQTKTPTGILVYLNMAESTVVDTNRDEAMGLLIGRNLMADYTSKKFRLPPLVDNKSTCNRCFVSEECMLYHKALENGTAATSGVPSLFIEKTGSLSQKRIDFIKLWEGHLSVEEENTQKTSKSLWTTPASIREKDGYCISGLAIINQISLKGRFSNQYTLRKEMTTSSQPVKSFLDNTSFGEGDPVVVTYNDSYHPIAIGFLQSLNQDSVVIFTDKPIEKPNEIPKLYKIDKDSYSSGVGMLRGNLLSLFDSTKNSKLCRLIVDLEPPEFINCDKSFLSSLDDKINDDQANAIVKCLSCLDYTLILGMPGTGKTSTISSLIKILVSRGKSVLFTAYTHSAVDNLLLKLCDTTVDFLRLGTYGKMHPKIRALSMAKLQGIETTSELEKVYDSTLLVATTALGVGHPIFARRRFDYCIVDESSQIALPVCLGPLQMAQKFVLVGDHYQLPPLFAQSDTNQVEPVSLFQHLSEAHPNATCYLKLQYRMNQDIMELANCLIYDYRLRCGNDLVKNGKLQTPLSDRFLEMLHGNGRICTSSPCWIETMLNPAKSVLFFNTDALPAPEIKTGPWIENPIEVDLVYQAVTSLLQSGLLQNEIGVVSPYRYQLQKISKALAQYSDIEIQTVDKYQGRDKKCIIMSLVRSNNLSQSGDLIKDWRRVNVAITRAEVKFIIFGSENTVKSSTCFDHLFKLLRKRNWIYQLPLGSNTLHSFAAFKYQGDQSQPIVNRFGTPKSKITDPIEF